MGNWLSQVLSPVIRPTARFVVGLIAIPMLRMLRRKLQPHKEWDQEFEKDLEQWVRASMVLMLATKNVETAILAWIVEKRPEVSLEESWWFAFGRILLAIGVIESMPDQQLFSILHPGPRKPQWIRGIGLIENVRRQALPMARGLICLHLNRSSPVFAILSVLFDGQVGWTCFLIAITQYLIIGLVTSREKVIDVLSRFDDEVAHRRQAVVDELQNHGPATEERPQSGPLNHEDKAHAIVVSMALESEVSQNTTPAAQGSSQPTQPSPSPHSSDQRSSS